MPVGLAAPACLVMKPLGKTLEHGFLPVPEAAPAPLESVPLLKPYGAVPTGVGMTVAVLKITTSEVAAALLPPRVVT